MKKEFSVFAQNLAYYNEGMLVGDWIKLPQNPKVIGEYLKEVVKVDKEHEEYEIADVDELPFSYESVQWSDLYKLNQLAIIYSSLDENEKEAIQCHLDSVSNSYSVEELINICLQVEKIDFYHYYFTGIENCSNFSPELKLGYTMAEETGLYEKLEELGVVDFFDFEKYGKNYGYDYILSDNGYLVMDYSIDTNFYNEEEIKETVNEILQENEMEIEM